jgi:hypothetical protein
VDLLDESLLVERLQVAADGHVGHTEQADEIRDPHGTFVADPVEDQGLALPGQRRHG